MHRTFIAIPVSDDTKAALIPLVHQLEEQMPVGAFRFLDPESWHITLSFLGDQSDEEVGQVVSALPSVVPMLGMPPEVHFERLIYWPDAENPSALVAVGDSEASAALGEVREILEDGLIAHEVRFRPDNRRFTAHITVAKRTKESVLLPELDMPIDVICAPELVEYLESYSEKGESRYEVLAGEPVTGGDVIE